MVPYIAPTLCEIGGPSAVLGAKLKALILHSRGFAHDPVDGVLRLLGVGLALDARDHRDHIVNRDRRLDNARLESQ